MKREHPLWQSCGGSVKDFEQLGLQLGVLFFADGADPFLQRAGVG